MDHIQNYSSRIYTINIQKNAIKTYIFHILTIYRSPPIVYDDYYYRENVQFSSDKSYADYYFRPSYHYNSKLSQIKENDTFTILSPVISTIINFYKYGTIAEKILYRKLISKLYNTSLSDKELFDILFWKGTAKDLIFNYTLINSSNLSPNFEIPTQTFRLIGNNSGSQWRTNTGYYNKMDFAKTISWARTNGSNYTLFDDPIYTTVPCWKTPYLISPGRFYYMGVGSPLNDKYNIDPLYIDVVFRNFKLNYDYEYNFKGINVYRYNISIKPELDSQDIYKPNEQFYQIGPSGVVNLTSCYSGVPVFVSLVDFLGSEYSINNSLIGLPNVSYDNWPWIGVEPKTGAIFEANAHMTLSTTMDPLPMIDNITINKDGYSLFNLKGGLMIPLYEIGYQVSLNSNTAKGYKNKLYWVNVLHFISILLGVICSIIVMILSWYYSYKCGKYRMKNKYN